MEENNYINKCSKCGNQLIFVNNNNKFNLFCRNCTFTTEIKEGLIDSLNNNKKTFLCNPKILYYDMTLPRTNNYVCITPGCKYSTLSSDDREAVLYRINPQSFETFLICNGCFKPNLIGKMFLFKKK